MRNAQKQLAESLISPAKASLRFGVIEGNRKNQPAQEAKPLIALPSIKRRHRGLHLVSGTHNLTNEIQPLSTFDQARQIVAQVEWEIEQQATRERQKPLRYWQPLAFAMAENRMPVQRSKSISGMTRLRRFLGL